MKLETYIKINKGGKEVTKQRYPKLYGKRRQEQKREEGEQRDEACSKLTDKEKLVELDKRPGECNKQREKLLKGLESGDTECIMEKEKSR